MEENTDDSELYESQSDLSPDMDTWIGAFCALSGHEYFAEIAEDFIEDDFNLTGLSAFVPHYKEALEMILDVEPEDGTRTPDVMLIEHSAELLYGLIHQRYILSRQGIQQMAEKYDLGHFGHCPRVFCSSTLVLPVGRYDTPGNENVKLFCPSCGDIYTPPNSRFQDIDGVYFGTTFANLFFESFPDLVPKIKQTKLYQPKIYGFKVSERAKTGPRMSWLRMKPDSAEDLSNFQRLSSSPAGSVNME